MRRKKKQEERLKCTEWFGWLRRRTCDLHSDNKSSLVIWMTIVMGRKNERHHDTTAQLQFNFTMYGWLSIKQNINCLKLQAEFRWASTTCSAPTASPTSRSSLRLCSYSRRSLAPHSSHRASCSPHPILIGRSVLPVPNSSDGPSDVQYLWIVMISKWLIY